MNGKFFRHLFYDRHIIAAEVTLEKTDSMKETFEVTKKIRERLETAQSQQNNYANKRRRPCEFHVGDAVHLKVSPL